MRVDFYQLGATQPEVAVHRGHDAVELGQDVVGIIERPVGQDVALGPLEQPECPGVALVPRVDCRPLLMHALDAQSARVAGGSRMIGDAQVLQPRGSGRLGHLLQGRAAVAPVGVAMKRAAQVGSLDQTRQLAPRRGLNLAVPPAQLGRDQR